MEKYKLLRDGQIVGYKRVNAGRDEFSYDNQEWANVTIPFDIEKKFLSFDQVNLVEIYED